MCVDVFLRESSFTLKCVPIWMKKYMYFPGENREESKFLGIYFPKAGDI